jgi:hypothetical protein
MGFKAKRFFKKAASVALAPVTAMVDSGRTAVEAGKSILSGDTNGAIDTLVEGNINASKAFAENSTGGKIFKTSTNDPVKEDMGQLPSEKTAEEIASAEQDTRVQEYKNSILNRSKGRFSNSLLGGGYF